eukprot:scaffold2090_cov225-Prasinococcus_capsulatus_cf.AAC.37
MDLRLRMLTSTGLSARIRARSVRGCSCSAPPTPTRSAWPLGRRAGAHKRRHAQGARGDRRSRLSLGANVWRSRSRATWPRIMRAKGDQVNAKLRGARAHC